jgi:hypothetical protein
MSFWHWCALISPSQIEACVLTRILVLESLGLLTVGHWCVEGRSLYSCIEDIYTVALAWYITGTGSAGLSGWLLSPSANTFRA